MAQYTPKMDNHDINVNKRDSTKTVIVVTLITLVGAVMIFLGLFFAISLFFQTVSLEQEQKWFSWFDDAVDGEVVTNKQMKEIFRKAGVAETIKVKIMCDKNLNAFAWPGGNIVITSEVLKKLNTEEGLAFVVGHEMGHIKNRDHLRGMARSVTFILVDVLTGISQWPGSGALFTLLESAYSRDQEMAADALSLKQMRDSYGHTKGGDEFFVAIQAEPVEKLHKTLWFISSHPLTADRLAHFETLNKDFLSERIITQRRDLFDEVLCESGCDKEACERERSGSPKSQIQKGKKPITLKDPSAPRDPSQTPAT